MLLFQDTFSNSLLSVITTLSSHHFISFTPPSTLILFTRPLTHPTTLSGLSPFPLDKGKSPFPLDKDKDKDKGQDKDKGKDKGQDKDKDKGQDM